MSTLTFNAVYEDAGSGWANARTCRSWPKPIRKGEGLASTANLVRRDSASTQFREFTGRNLGDFLVVWHSTNASIRAMLGSVWLRLLAGSIIRSSSSRPSAWCDWAGSEHRPPVAHNREC
jgi:hypothetical protein